MEETRTEASEDGSEIPAIETGPEEQISMLFDALISDKSTEEEEAVQTFKLRSPHLIGVPLISLLSARNVALKLSRSSWGEYVILISIVQSEVLKSLWPNAAGAAMSVIKMNAAKDSIITELPPFRVDR